MKIPVLTKIKNLFVSFEEMKEEIKAELASVTTKDGVMLDINEDTLIVSKVLEDGSLEPVGEGEWTLSDESVIKTDAESKLVKEDEVIDLGKRAVNSETEQSTEVAEAVAELEQFKSEKTKLEKQLKYQTEKFTQLQEKFNLIEKELTDLKKTSVEKFSAITKPVNTKPLTRKDIIQRNLRESLNK